MSIQRLLPFGLLAIAIGCVSRPPPQQPDAPAPEVAYRLPFRAGTRHLCIQGGPGPFGHSGAQRFAIDFRMPVGTSVHAARAGRVVAVKQDSAIGGVSQQYRGHANYVRVRHDDGSWAIYLHLERDGALVREGQAVRRGERIGYSGSTGRSALPHLHFHVARRDTATGRVTSVPVVFGDVAGDGVPRPLWSYVSGNEPAGP